MRSRVETRATPSRGPRGDTTAGARPDVSPATTAAVRGRRQALVDWLLGDRDDDAVPVTVLANPDTVGGTDLVGGERWSVQELLYALWDDVAPIPGAMAASLGLPATASFGATARLLDLQRRQTPLATFTEVVDELLRGTQDLGRHRRILPRT